MKNGRRKKNVYHVLTHDGHIIQVRNKVTETILDSFLGEKGCNEINISEKRDVVTNPYRKKKLTTLLQTCNLEVNTPHGRF